MRPSLPSQLSTAEGIEGMQKDIGASEALAIVPQVVVVVSTFHGKSFLCTCFKKTREHHQGLRDPGLGSIS